MIAFVGILSLVVALIMAAMAFFVLSRARVAVPDGNAPVYKVRKVYATILVVALVGALILTLGKTPYTAYAGQTADVQVEAIGRMWSWEFKVDGKTQPTLTLPKGKLIEFAVSATDVNHGFGVYDHAGNLIAQTQAMPGYTNRLRMVFDDPGKYHVLCLEYCGLMHHNMLTEFTIQ